MDIYPVHISLHVVESTVKWTEVNRFPVNNNRIACCGRDNHGNFMLVFQYNYITHRIVAHEIAHCVFRIAEYIGMPHEDASDEAYAALHEHLTAWIYSACKKHGTKICYD